MRHVTRQIDVWLLDDKRAILLTDIPGPPVGGELLASMVDYDDAMRLARREGQRRGYELRFEWWDFLSWPDSEEDDDEQSGLILWDDED